MTMRVHKRERFTSVSNEIINNKEMSWEARGLLIYLLSKPEGWIVRNNDLIKQSPAGRDKVASIVQELARNGHIFRWQCRETDGRIEWKSEIFESPEEMREWRQENPDIADPSRKSTPNNQGHHNGKTVSGEPAHHNGKTVSGSTVNGKDVDIVITEFSNTELDPEIFIDPIPHTHSDPERVCVKNEKSPEPESIVSPEQPKSFPVFSKSIGVDNFSAAAPLNSSIEGFPIGPWGRDLFSIHPGFMAAVIAKWRKGNSQKAQAFGAMVDEEVRGCIQKYWRKDWTTLRLDWTEYEDSTKRLAQTVRDRMSQGVEITSQEQKILTDRVMGPEHLRPQALYSDLQQAVLNPARLQRELPSGAVPLIADNELTESQIEETRRAIEAARSNLMKSNQSLFEGRNPVPDFMAWLLEEAKKHPVPGMAVRAIAVILARRPEMQTAYLSSRNATERELSYSGSEDF